MLFFISVPLALFFRYTFVMRHGVTRLQWILEHINENSMFLTKDQRKRKALLIKDQTSKRNAIDAERKLLNDKAQRDAWAQQAHAPESSYGGKASYSHVPLSYAAIATAPKKRLV